METHEFTKNRPGFSQLRTVCAAIGEKCARTGVNCLCVEEDTIVATDGKRLCYADNVYDLPPGLYTVQKLTKSTVWLSLADEPAKNYPKWRTVIPENYDRRFTIRAPEYSAEQLAYHLAQHGRAFNHRFLQAIEPGECVVEFVNEAPGRPIRITADHVIHIIMPVDMPAVEVKPIEPVAETVPA